MQWPEDLTSSDLRFSAALFSNMYMSANLVAIQVFTPEPACFRETSTQAFACYDCKYSLTQTQHMRGTAHQGEHLNITQYMHLSVVESLIVCTLQVELAQYAHLCTIMSNMHHRRSGYPFGTIVDFASDGAGCPLFCLSPLAIHTRNIMEDPRCSLVVQMPGWTGMANARVTIFGDVYQLPPDMHEAAREVLLYRPDRSHVCTLMHTHM